MVGLGSAKRDNAIATFLVCLFPRVQALRKVWVPYQQLLSSPVACTTAQLPHCIPRRGWAARTSTSRSGSIQRTFTGSVKGSHRWWRRRTPRACPRSSMQRGHTHTLFFARPRPAPPLLCMNTTPLHCRSLLKAGDLQGADALLAVTDLLV